MVSLASPIELGSLRLPNRVFLAPLAGVTDTPFRRICQELGAGLTYVEMVSATAINYENRKTLGMLDRHSSEKTLGVQVVGEDPAGIAKAIATLSSMGFDSIDINMGCPVKKVVNSGGGSALLREPERISAILSAAREITSKPLSVKYRIGYTRENVNVQDTTRRALEASVDMFTIHGRTRSEGYSVPVDLDGIKSGIEFARTYPTKRPFVSVGNGDIFSHLQAEKMVEYCGCDAVMVSRGAMGNPWIFRQILNGGNSDVTLEEWEDVILRHLSYHQELYGEGKVAAIVARKHLLWYSHGFPGIKVIRPQLSIVESLAEARTLIRTYTSKLPRDLLRHSGKDLIPAKS